jgi:hypothetical protein
MVVSLDHFAFDPRAVSPGRQGVAVFRVSVSFFRRRMKKLLCAVNSLDCPLISFFA